MLLVWILAPKKWIIILIVLAEFCFLGTEAVEQEEIQYFLFFFRYRDNSKYNFEIGALLLMFFLVISNSIFHVLVLFLFYKGPISPFTLKFFSFLFQHRYFMLLSYLFLWFKIPLPNSHSKANLTCMLT